MRSGLLILVAAVVYAAAMPAAALILGVWAPIPDVNDAHIQEVGAWAVAEHGKRANDGLRFGSVVSGEQQVVAGMNYRLVVDAMNLAGQHVRYNAAVYEVEWTNTRELQSFEKAANRAASEAAAPPSSAPRKGDADTDLLATEMVVSNDDYEFYTKELEPDQGQKSPAAAAAVTNDKQLDAARAEIMDLRFSLEKASLERELREEIRKKHATRRRAASFSEDAIRPALERAPWPRPTPSPSATPRVPRSSRPQGEDMPTPRCLTLGKVLSMIEVQVNVLLCTELQVHEASFTAESGALCEQIIIFGNLIV
ncbi:hypothetical protein ACP70R_017205 [Stipagrostis hirtigluma subsp. patula]